MSVISPRLDSSYGDLMNIGTANPAMENQDLKKIQIEKNLFELLPGSYMFVLPLGNEIPLSDEKMINVSSAILALRISSITRPTPINIE
jgi:hypothetical protein